MYKRQELESGLDAGAMNMCIGGEYMIDAYYTLQSVSYTHLSMMYGCATTPGFITLDGITTNISYATAPDMLSQFTGLKTYNLGVNGETSKEIATRAGGLTMVVDRDIVIDGTGIAEFKLQSLYDGDNVYMEDYSGYNLSLIYI